MKILADMNIRVEWVGALEKNGWECVHWSEVGDIRAEDHEIMAWARINDYIVFTHDLDFSAILAITRAYGPSVVQIRSQDITIQHLEAVVVSALRQFEDLLMQGALVSMDEARVKARVLPIK